MEIRVVLKQQYGQEVIEPVCEDAKLFAQMAGTKMLTRKAIEIIKKLGYKVTVMRTEPEEL